MSNDLEDFFKEYCEWKTYGLQLENVWANMYLNIKAYFCNAPAKAFMKVIKGHTSDYDSERCIIKGYSKINWIIISINNIFMYSKDACFLTTDRWWTAITKQVDIQ